LSFEVLFLPPLRCRGEDIMLLANHFATRMAFELGRKSIPVFADTAVRELEEYSWKGNIRELKNVVERAVYRSERPVVHDITFNPFISPYTDMRQPEQGSDQELLGEPDQGPGTCPASLPEALAELEISSIRKALKKSRNNQRQAAFELGLTYDQLRGRIRKYGDAVYRESE
jgi:psp operon transcriptional activator